MITINSIDSASVDEGQPGTLTAIIRATSRTVTVQQWQTALDAWVQSQNVARDERITEARTEEQAAKDAAIAAAVATALAEKDAIIAAKQAEIDALTPAPVPDGVTVRTPLQILGLLTPTEYGTIWTAAQQSPEVSLWFDMLRAASEVRSDDARTVGGIQAMVGLGFLTSDRALEIFGVTL